MRRQRHSFFACREAPCLLCRRLSEVLDEYVRVTYYDHVHPSDELVERLFLVGYAADIANGDASLDKLTEVLQLEHGEGRLLGLWWPAAHETIARLVHQAGSGAALSVPEWQVRQWSDAPLDQPVDRKRAGL